MKIGAIIQARMGSTRLSGKVMKKLKGKTVLSHVIERVRQSKIINEVIIATTILDRDDIIENEAIKCDAKVFRGSEDDVLSRYYHAAKENSIDIIIRITSDCPLIDPHVIDEIVSYYLDNEYDIVTNACSDLSKRTYPRGLDTEVFSLKTLENAFHQANEKYQREHVTPYIYETNDKAFFYRNNIDYSMHRWTLDTEEDFELIEKIYDKLYRSGHRFYLSDIINIFKNEPELININAHVEQKKVKL